MKGTLKGCTMTETRDKLLLLARDRLRNRPGEYRRFQNALETVEGTRMLTLAGALPTVTRQAADYGIQRAVEAERAHLLAIVDRWAEAQPKPLAVEPLSNPGAAMNLPPLGTGTDELTPAKRTAKPAAQVDRGGVLKKTALIKKHERQWKTINRDFQDASDNGLSRDAKAPEHGNWFEADALNWARQRGKLRDDAEQQTLRPATPFSGLMHRIQG